MVRGAGRRETAVKYALAGEEPAMAASWLDAVALDYVARLPISPVIDTGPPAAVRHAKVNIYDSVWRLPGRTYSAPILLRPRTTAPGQRSHFPANCGLCSRLPTGPLTRAHLITIRRLSPPGERSRHAVAAHQAGVGTPG